MELLELLMQRRSVRRFLPQDVEQDKIDKIIAGTLTAPSSKNCRSTRLAVIKDRAMLRSLASMRSSGSALLADAPLGIAVMADASLSDMWRENCSISATVLQLMAESLGLGSCWVHVFGRPQDNDRPDGPTAEDYVHELLPATVPYRIMCIVAVGYPESRPHPHSGDNNEGKVIGL